MIGGAVEAESAMASKMSSASAADPPLEDMTIYDILQGRQKQRNDGLLVPDFIHAVFFVRDTWD